MNTNFVIGATIVVIGAVAGIALTTSTTRPRIESNQDLPEDVRRLTDETWVEFNEVFAAKSGCLGGVSLELVEEVVDGAARYVASSSHIQIEIPTTPARYQESLIHELGHHLEEVCGVELEIGGQFREAQHFDMLSDWRGVTVWAERPTEHFAESVVQLVLGARQTHADIVELTPKAVDLVGRWALLSPTVQGPDR